MTARALLIAALSAAALPAFAVEKASEQVLPFYGSFGYEVPIELPPFRGLEPRLALAYSSEGRNGFAGVGWNLSGVSVIERASPGRGVPNWDSNDIYLLDGQELYPCQVGSVSPSCTSGGGAGRYSTKVETYARVRFDSGSNTWTVTSKTGIRMVYSPVYTTASGTLRWGQTSTIDTRDNTVSYAWQFADGDAYPYEISYGPYRVTFYREGRGDVISFATGPALGLTTNRLMSVVVSLQGGPNIRAYKLGYSPSTLTSQSLLTSVQTYGKDVIHSGGVITGGSALPAQIFSYQTDAAGKSFADLTQPPTVDPVTENVSWASRINAVEAGSGNSLQKVNGVSTAWDAGGSSTRAIASGDGYVETTSISEPGPWQKRWGLSRDDESVDPNDIDFAFQETPTAIWVMENGTEPLPGTWWAKQANDVLRIEVVNRKVYYKQNGIVRYQSTQVPVYPLRLDGSIYQMSTTISNAMVSAG